MNCVNSRDKPYKNTVLEWANDADFTCNEFIVYHEDENVICGRHSFEVTDEPKQQVMFLHAMKVASANFGEFTAVETLFNQFLVQLKPMRTILAIGCIK